MRSSAPLWGPLVIVAAFAGCNALLGTDEGKAASADASSDAGAEGSQGTTPFDGGPSFEHPPDKPCVREIWSQPKQDPSCEARRVTTIASDVIDPPDLAIERARSGRTVIAYSRAESAEHGTIEVAQFADPKSAKKTTIGEVGFNRYGELSLAKLGEESVLLAYHWASAGALAIEELGPKGTMRPPEDIATNLSTSSVHLDLATTADGTAHVVYFDDATKSLSHKTRQRAGSAWSARAEIDSGFVVDGVAGSGQVSLELDSQGRPHVAYNKAIARTSSAPYYKSSVEGSWSTGRLQIEKGGSSAYGIALGVFGENRCAAFYAPGTQSRYRQLHFANWSGGDVAGSEIAIVEDNITIDDELRPNTVVAMAVDDWGWVHLVTAFRTGFDVEIRYTRQAMIDGKLRFITDTVDTLPTTNEASSPRVALVVDERARPHIAYHGGADGVVRYATIYDE